MKLIKRGKVKDVYEFDTNNLVFHFSNRVSAFDVIMKDEIPYKGKVLCDFAIFWFSTLKIKNHFVKRLDVDKIMVKKLDIIPIECIVRNYLYGSLYSRYVKNEIDLSSFKSSLTENTLKLASKLPFALFDPTTKSDIHDVPITMEKIIERKMLSKKDLDFIKERSVDLFNQMDIILDSSNFILADVKFEFGYHPTSGEILLADSIGPDEFRIWSKDNYVAGKVQESFDKQILRDWLEQIGFKKNIDEYSKLGLKPEPPQLPYELINKISESYIYAYERITKSKFDKSK